MSDRLERVLELLDTGTQSSPEPGYGTDWRPQLCARCQRHDPMPDGDLCEGCRAFLLDDTDEDPASPWRTSRVSAIETAEVTVSVDTRAFQAATRATAAALVFTRESPEVRWGPFVEWLGFQDIEPDNCRSLIVHEDGSAVAVLLVRDDNGNPVVDDGELRLSFHYIGEVTCPPPLHPARRCTTDEPP